MNSQQDLSEDPGGPASETPKRKNRKWFFVLPLLAWLACLGLLMPMVVSLVRDGPAGRIPVTGGDPQESPASPTLAEPLKEKTVTGSLYLDMVTERLESCTIAFHHYFLLEQLAVDSPDVFHDDNWRSDVTDAMQTFREDCQRLGTLPSAPAAYVEVDRWLKLAAGEVGPSADNLATAIDEEQVFQLQASVEHLLKFVDYIQNAEEAMDGIRQRKEI